MNAVRWAIHRAAEQMFTVSLPTQPSITIQTGRSANADCTALRVSNVKRASFLLEVGALRPEFYENGVISCQNFDTVRYGATTFRQ